MNVPEMLTVEETASIIRTSPAMTRKLIRRGEIQAINRRGHYFVERAEVCRYLGPDHVELTPRRSA